MSEVGSPVLILNALIALIVLGVPVALIAILAREGRGTRGSERGPGGAIDDAPAGLAHGPMDHLEFERLRSILQRR